MYTFSGVEDLAVILIKTELSLRNERDIRLFRAFEETGRVHRAGNPVKFPDARQGTDARGGQTAASRFYLRHIQAG
ncbi:MAG: hypothetical protein RDA78_01520 [Roseibium sp.]|uniref:hypothetical protein n=1 Tax=Roseibium sp. TaxID=1936156 RepID=UPI003D9C36E1